MAKGCPPLRWALYSLALAGMAHSEDYKLYVTSRKAEGKKGGLILIIIGRQLLDRIWAVARTKNIFSPEDSVKLAGATNMNLEQKVLTLTIVIIVLFRA